MVVITSMSQDLWSTAITSRRSAVFGYVSFQQNISEYDRLLFKIFELFSVIQELPGVKNYESTAVASNMFGPDHTRIASGSMVGYFTILLGCFGSSKDTLVVKNSTPKRLEGSPLRQPPSQNLLWQRPNSTSSRSLARLSYWCHTTSFLQITFRCCFVSFRFAPRTQPPPIRPMAIERCVCPLGTSEHSVSNRCLARSYGT